MSNGAALSEAVEKPAHVPDSHAYDFDFYFDPDDLNDAHARIFDLLANAPPIFWTPRNGGTVMGPLTLHQVWGDS